VAHLRARHGQSVNETKSHARKASRSCVLWLLAASTGDRLHNSRQGLSSGAAAVLPYLTLPPPGAPQPLQLAIVVHMLYGARALAGPDKRVAWGCWLVADAAERIARSCSFLFGALLRGVWCGGCCCVLAGSCWPRCWNLFCLGHHAVALKCVVCSPGCCVTPCSHRCRLLVAKVHAHHEPRSAVLE
jgi:hypothetical protein